MKNFYITTPIYYPSERLHIGHAYASVCTDALARYHRQKGENVYFLTGTDEHGQKIQRKAREHGVSPKEYVDPIVDSVRELWRTMNVDYDGFIRTTDARHIETVQRIFQRLHQQGDIYKKHYEGWYCTPCESFWTTTQAKDGLCPDCGRPVEQSQEECYFLRLSQHADWLIDYIENNPDFVQPASRANEMLNNFLRPGLEDLCVSRTSLTWGVPVTFDPGHVVYVWVDALSNYISALGYTQEDASLFEQFWPADVHIVGKEIIRFHVIVWPILLKMLGLPLPKRVFGHGWLVMDGLKMSKSRGNVIDPALRCGRYSADAVRYFLLRDVTFGADGHYTDAALLGRINTDLANDLGNLVSRTVAMIEKYREGSIPAPGSPTDFDLPLCQSAQALPGLVDAHMEGLQPSLALQEIWNIIGLCNRYIDQTAPWVLAKDPALAGQLDTVLYHLAECVRIVGVLLTAFMPNTPPRIFAQLGIPKGLQGLQNVGFGASLAGLRVEKGPALFPRLDIPAELAALAGDEASNTGENNPVADDAKPNGDGKRAANAAKATPSIGAAQGQEKLAGVEANAAGANAKSAAADAPNATAGAAAQPDGSAQKPISIDTFFQSQMKVARVLSCQRVENADKLLLFSLDVGEDTPRTVVSGIAAHYVPETLIGQNLILLANLKPAKIRGIVSQGMLLSAQDAATGALRVLTVPAEVAPGSEVG